MSNESEPEVQGFWHHNQIVDVIIEKSDYDIKYLIKMQKACGLFVHCNWTCGQSNCVVRILKVLTNM